MLTFGKVIEVFRDYLSEDNMYEIVSTSHGYTVLEWDSQCEEWTGAKLCKKPQDMADVLLYGYTGFLEYRATLGRRELTEKDRAQVEIQRSAILKKLQE